MLLFILLFNINNNINPPACVGVVAFVLTSLPYLPSGQVRRGITSKVRVAYANAGVANARQRMVLILIMIRINVIT